MGWNCARAETRRKRACQGPASRPPGLLHRPDAGEADDGGGGDVIADPGQAAPLQQLLGEIGRERGAEDAAEIIGDRGAGIGDVGGEEFGQLGAERGEGEAHHAERDTDEQQRLRDSAADQIGQGEADERGERARGEQHRPAPDAIGERGRDRRGDRHAERGDAEHPQIGRARDVAFVDAIAEREHRRDVEQRVADDDRQRALENPVAAWKDSQAFLRSS